MKVRRKIIEINEELCNGCGQCVPSCAEGAIQIIDGKARLVAEKYCDGLGACLGECPTGALKITERLADDFDADAVQEYLDQQEGQREPEPKSQTYQQNQADQQKEGRGGQKPQGSLACGCPSAAHPESLGHPQGADSRAKASSSQSSGQEATSPTTTPSALSHWPVQIRLVPSSAPFLKGAELLVIADCTAVAYPSLHSDFLPGRVVLMGCPKFDQADEYIRKFAAIFKTAGIQKVTVLMMEVPCCGGLSVIVERGLAEAGVTIPVERLRITTQGKLLKVP